MSKIIHLIDRSRVAAREECGQLRYLGYDFDGDGLDASEPALPLLSGIAIHNAHARLLAGDAIDDVVAWTVAAYTQEIKTRGLFDLEVTKILIKEQAFLLECMLRTWATLRLPQILEEYEVVEIEKPWVWELAPGIGMSRRDDALLRRRDDGYLHILDFKTLGYVSELFFDAKLHDLQTCLYIQSNRERFDEPVAMIYEGLIKGRFMKESYRNCAWSGTKVQQSPYTMGYALRDSGMVLYRNTYTNKKGYTKVRLCEEMSAKEWVHDWMLTGNEQDFTPANELFVVVPAIEPPTYELERVKRQVVNEELLYHERLANYREAVKSGSFSEADLQTFNDRLFPMRTNRCYKFGQDHRCKFTDICFNQGAQPLAEGGGFIKRVPHHDTDLEMVA